MRVTLRDPSGRAVCEAFYNYVDARDGLQTFIDRIGFKGECSTRHLTTPDNNSCSVYESLCTLLSMQPR